MAGLLNIQWPGYISVGSLQQAHDVVQFLHEYLTKKDIPFTAYCFSGEDINPLPIRTDFSIKGEMLMENITYGIFHIFKDTEREMFFYNYGPIDKNNKHVSLVAYKKTEYFEEFLKEVKKFKSEYLKNKKTMIIDGDERPLEQVRWSDIILPETLLNSIKISVETFLKGRDIFKRMNLPYKRGILFAGEPGNGKTMLCKAIAWESKLPFIVCSLQKVFSDFDLDDTFELASELAPAIVCFEDIDSLNKTGMTLSYFLNKLDGFSTIDGVMVLATTNKPEEIDMALKNRPSRFDSVFRIPFPDFQSRAKMLKKFFNEMLDDDTIFDVARKTKGFSMAYMKELYILSAMAAFKKQKELPDKEDLEKAIRILRKQITFAEKSYEEDKTVGFIVENLLDN